MPPLKKILFDTRTTYALWRVMRNKDFFLGNAVKQFERNLCVLTKSVYAVGVSSGTDAIVLSLKALGIGSGDEVIVPAVSFFSTASAVAWVGATPVFVDIDLQTYNIDSIKIQRAITKRTRAIIPVYLDGRIADMETIELIAKKYSLYVIADAAHALGSQYKNKTIGGWGDVACLSFSFTKSFGSYGNAGAILTNKENIYKMVLPLRMYGSPAKNKIHTEHIVPSGSHRLDSFQAATLNCKMPHWNEIIKTQQACWQQYYESLCEIPRLSLPINSSDSIINGFRFTIRTPHKQNLQKFLAKNRVKLIDYYQKPLPFLSAFQKPQVSKNIFPIAEQFCREAVTLPTYNVNKKKIKYITSKIKDFLYKI